MNIIVKLLALLISNVLADHQTIDSSPSWYYSNNGKEQWPESCNGKKQSPVDIKDYDIEIVKYSELKLINYEKSVQCKSVNNGHTVMFTINENDNLYISGGNLRKKYLLQQIHFHWGSEHTLNGKRYPLEVHFVHVSSKNRNRRHLDVDESDGIHVLAVLYFVNKNGNHGLSEVFKTLKNISSVGTSDILKINPRSLLPMNLGEFYRYEGSLTTPNCNENVQWTVFASRVPISTEQYDIIKRTETFNGSNSINYRTTQPLNNRSLKYVFTKPTSDAHRIYLDIFYLLIIMGCVRFNMCETCL